MRHQRARSSGRAVSEWAGPCRRDECAKAASANGLCRFHGRQADRGERLTPIPESSSGRRGPKGRKPVSLGDGSSLAPLVGSDGGYAIVDDDDLDDVIGQRWVADRRDHTTYARCLRKCCGPRGQYLHQFIMGKPPRPGLTVDHINRDGLDNRRSNLRWATAKEQAANRGSRRRSAREPQI